MILRTILFFVILYFLIKIVSRLFLSSSTAGRGQQRGSQSGAQFFYSVFNQARQNAQRRNQQQNSNGSNSGNGNVKQRIDEIEEAEYEEITDEEENKSEKK